MPFQMKKPVLRAKSSKLYGREHKPDIRLKAVKGADKFQPDRRVDKGRRKVI